jgi:diguanylate cyclase (GGDEF)-like protein/PAS domain S-box-containing protein
MNLTQRFRSTRLLGLIWPLVCVSVLQAVLMVVSLDLLASMRAYVNGESLWAKGQQTAIYYLDRYIQTGRDAHYQRYLEALAVPMGDRRARLAMEAPVVDQTVAREGLIAGGNHVADVSRMIRLFSEFGGFPPVREAVRVWRGTDAPLLKLQALGSEIRDSMQHTTPDDAALERWQGELETLNAQLMPMAVNFSSTLSAGARQIVGYLVLLNAGAGIVLIAIGVLATRRLLRQREEVEAALANEQARAQVTLASIGDAVLTIDELGSVRYMNAAAERLLRRRADFVLRTPITDVLHLFDQHARVEGEKLVGMLLEGEADRSAGLQIERADGTRVAVSLVATPMRSGVVSTGAVLVFHDMTREHQYVADLSWQASHDALTGLANRREFDVRVRRAMARLDEQGGLHAMLYLDLDQFKLVNDTCGHDAGDELLCHVSRQLQSCLRERDTLARLGGDEFGVLLENCAPDDAMQIAEKLRDAIESLHFSSGGRNFTVYGSIGLVCLEPGAFQPEEAMRAADLACYLAKEKGRNRVQVYSTENVELSARFDQMLRAQELQQALKDQRFMLDSQIVVPVAAGRDDGHHVELLLRLIDNSGRTVPPGEFLPAAERFGLMPQIDRWVVQNAFAALAERQRAGAAPLASCAINLSGATVGDRAFMLFVREQLARYGVAPHSICFEVTETVAVQNLDEAIHFIGELQALGCRFALDDFGAGMSSFAYLRQLPVDYVKIDGSFVKDMVGDPISRAMVETINRMASLMGKRTIAEFVESGEILDALRGIGVDYAQGYAIGRPQAFVAKTPAATFASA